MGQLGEMLYGARREAGVSLAELANATRIRATILEALEQGEWDALPNPGYLRGFIADYTRYLGIDSTPFLLQLEAETGVTRLGHERPRNRRETAPAISTRHRRHEVNIRPLLVAAGVVAIVGLAVWLAVVLWPDKNVVTPVPVSPDGSSVATATSQESTSSVAGAPFTLDISVVEGGASDVKVLVDGLVAFDGSLTSADEPLAYDVVESAVITLSNPSKVTVTQNGTAVPIDAAADTPFTLTAPAAE